MLYISNPISTNTDQCYIYSQKGYYAKECPTILIKLEVALVYNSYKDPGLPTSKLEEELELEELGKEQL